MKPKPEDKKYFPEQGWNFIAVGGAIMNKIQSFIKKNNIDTYSVYVHQMTGRESKNEDDLVDSRIGMTLNVVKIKDIPLDFERYWDESDKMYLILSDIHVGPFSHRSILNIIDCNVLSKVSAKDYKAVYFEHEDISHLTNDELSEIESAYGFEILSKSDYDFGREDM